MNCLGGLVALGIDFHQLRRRPQICIAWAAVIGTEMTCTLLHFSPCANSQVAQAVIRRNVSAVNY